ncbi:hypothetical protein U5907_03900 [Bacteroidales bacterium MB20-C3-3]|nr:hypothetical protein U5907_03900 [Bacteroidales bacterium MB20-C3-3]
MLIRVTSKLLTISRISAERCDSLPAEGFPGEWYANLYPAFQADTDCTIYATSSRSLLAVMSQMGISIESAFWDLRDSVGWDPDWDPADSDFVSLENRYLDYLIGGQTAKQRGEMYVSARELLEHLAVPGHLAGHLATVFGK